MVKIRENEYLHLSSGEIVNIAKLEYGDTIKLCCGLIVIKTPLGCEVLRQ